MTYFDALEKIGKFLDNIFNEHKNHPTTMEPYRQEHELFLVICKQVFAQQVEADRNHQHPTLQHDPNH